MTWRRGSDYHLQGEGFSICLARCGQRIAYSLWREPVADPMAGIKARVSGTYHRGVPDLLRTITNVDPTDNAARIAAVNELKQEAERYAQGV